jgi:hypothetical protein
MAITFSLQVSLGYGCDQNEANTLNKMCAVSPIQPAAKAKTTATTAGGLAKFFGGGAAPKPAPAAASDNKKSIFVVSASNLRMSLASGNSNSQEPSLAALFLPANILDRALERSGEKMIASGSCFWMDDESKCAQFTNDLLPRIHELFCATPIKGIVRTSIAAEDNAPSEVVILNLSRSEIKIADLLEWTSGQGMRESIESIIKLLPLSEIDFQIQQSKSSSLKAPSSHSLPTCPVCLHRIDPVRLGLPPPTDEQICTKFCPAPSFIGRNWVSDSSDSCPKQQYLKKWDAPSRCQACFVIHHFWSQLTSRDEANDLFCAECSMHKTLWVCLTCGYVGCGRYSNKHSVAHFETTGHQYSLELATLRIWDYVDDGQGGYAHRGDLLDCPSSAPLSHPWMVDPDAVTVAARNASLEHGDSFEAYSNGSSLSRRAEKNPKKATMIGEEYEALLQSALEDQALHYEGEISHLRASLTAALVDERTMNAEEQHEADALKADIADFQEKIEQAGRDLIQIQAQEANYRQASQLLLTEQQEANEVLREIEEQSRLESELGKMKIEDLETQISDLTANLRMRNQFSQNHELSNAQIFGTSGEKKSAKKGKKKGRLFRK